MPVCVCMFVQCVDVVRALLSECARVRHVCACASCVRVCVVCARVRRVCACGYTCFLSSCLNVV